MLTADEVARLVADATAVLPSCLDNQFRALAESHEQLRAEQDSARDRLGELVEEILATAREFDGVASSAARFNHCLRLAREFKRRADAEAGGGEG